MKQNKNCFGYYDLRQITNLLWDNRSIILICTFFSIVTSTWVSFTQPVAKFYQTHVLINPASIDNKNLLDVPETIKLVKDHSFLKSAVKRFCPNIQVPPVDNVNADIGRGRAIKITVVSAEPHEAACLANALSLVIVEQNNNLLYSSSSKITSKKKEGRIEQYAKFVKEPSWVKPRRILNIITAALIGFFTGIMLVLVMKKATREK